MTLKYRVIEPVKRKIQAAICNLFKVSRSGYYDWRKRQDKPTKEQWLTDLIVDCQQRCKQTYGYRRVKLWIEPQYGRKVNLKAILCIMRKFDLLSQVRRTRPYSHYHQTVHKYLNLLKRAFKQELPNRFWVTDITYIHTVKGMVYVCAVVDLCGKWCCLTALAII